MLIINKWINVINLLIFLSLAFQHHYSALRWLGRDARGRIHKPTRQAPKHGERNPAFPDSDLPCRGPLRDQGHQEQTLQSRRRWNPGCPHQRPKRCSSDSIHICHIMSYHHQSVIIAIPYGCISHRLDTLGNSICPVVMLWFLVGSLVMSSDLSQTKTASLSPVCV